MKKYAIVTGGSSGIGLGVAKLLLSKGYKVFITYNNTIPNIKSEELVPIQTNLAIREDIYRFISKIKNENARLDCIVCNAWMTIRKPFVNMTDNEWDTMMDISLTSHFIILRELFNQINSNSRIIFTGSQMGITPHATILAYGVIKAAIHAFVKNLVKEFEGTGTTVNAVVPGFVDTAWQKEKPEEIRRNICNKTALHRFASVDEIVDAFRFCLDNSYVNGSLIEINGGYSYK